MVDEELERTIRERAYALWETDGRPEGRELDYWRQAEQEILSQSVAGEEDPLEASTTSPPRPRRLRDGDASAAK